MRLLLPLFFCFSAVAQGPCQEGQSFTQIEEIPLEHSFTRSVWSLLGMDEEKNCMQAYVCRGGVYMSCHSQVPDCEAAEEKSRLEMMNSQAGEAIANETISGSVATPLCRDIRD